MSETTVILDEADARVLAAIMPDERSFGDLTTVAGMRQLIDRIQLLNGPGPEMFGVSEHAVPGADPAVRVRLIQPVPNPRGLMMYLGLGGWVAGSLDSWDTIARKLAERTSYTVALVAFRQGPEHPYPAAIEDISAAASWLWEKRSEHGQADLPLMIVGEGMGATLAALVVSRASTDPDGPAFALQVLVCPVADRCADSRTSLQESPFLSRAAFDCFWAWFLPDAPVGGAPRVEWCECINVAAFPPTVVVTAEHDPCCQGALAFVERLRDAGVAVAHRHYERQVHGFSSILALPLGERVFQHIIRAARGYTVRFCGDTPPPLDVGAWLDRIIK